MDQKLGYHGKDRFVLFYYEPRGEEVIWQDSHSSGFSTGFGQCFIDELSPVADVHKVHVGSSGTPAAQVLLIDRAESRSYFVERDEATRFLTSVEKKQREGESGSPDKTVPLGSLASLVEITHESIAKVAYHIWERHGRLEGLALRDWLQVQAQLRVERWASRK
jgi:hypothetical protein